MMQPRRQHTMVCCRTGMVAALLLACCVGGVGAQCKGHSTILKKGNYLINRESATCIPKKVRIVVICS